MFRKNFPFTLCAALGLLISAPACGTLFEPHPSQPPPVYIVVTETPFYKATVEVAIAQTQTAQAPTPNIQATIVAGVAGTQTALAPVPNTVPDATVLEDSVNIAVGKPVIARAGGVNYGSWNDDADFNSITKAKEGHWGNETNAGGGTYQIVDLGQKHEIVGVGYHFSWDGRFNNPLTFVVEVSNDMETWTRISEVIHPYDGVNGSNKVDVNLPVEPVMARYVKFWEPPDGAWNGWSDFWAIRVFASK